MTAKQVVASALILAVVCCLIMWWLEDFRARKWMSQLQEELARIPTYGGGTGGDQGLSG